MVNYKIHRIQIKNSDVSVEVQNLLISAGLKWNISKEPRVEHPYGYPITLFIRWEDKEFFCGYDSYAENINVDELRDLVVLKRNDVKDATHADQDRRAYLDSEGKYHFYIHAENKWNYSQDVQYVGKYLKPIVQLQDPALISGAEALRALADGKDVEFKHESQGWVPCLGLNIESVLGGWHQMRLKPQTIKVELELPKPFEPKVGEVYYYLKPGNAWGFGCGEWGDDSMQNEYIQYGAWPTKEDVLKVVEQLRKIRGTNS